MFNPEAHALIHSLDRRFAGLPRFIRLLEQNDTIEAFHSNVIGAIPLRVLIHYGHLKAAFRGSIEMMAWASRNLLEMLVWAMYISESKDNARRFHDDQGIDLRRLLDDMQGLVKTFNAEPEKNLTQIDRDRAVLATKMADSSLSGDEEYLNIGKQARNLGVAGMFYALNGLYSKFTHPTALSIMVVLTPEQDEQLRTLMATMAVLSTKDALDIIAELCRSLGTDTALIEDQSYTDPGTLRPRPSENPVQ